MAAITPFHVLVVLSAVAIVYALWMMYFTIRESHRMNNPGHKEKSSRSGEKERREISLVRAVLSYLRRTPSHKLPKPLKLN